MTQSDVSYTKSAHRETILQFFFPFFKGIGSLKFAGGKRHPYVL
jgi:hypothetical protein